MKYFGNDHLALVTNGTCLQRLAGENVLRSSEGWFGVDHPLAPAGHRVAISNDRVLDIADEKVQFRWKDYRDACKKKTMTLPSRPREFHPGPLTEPDVNVSAYPARATARRLPPSVKSRAHPVTG